MSLFQRFYQARRPVTLSTKIFPKTISDLYNQICVQDDQTIMQAFGALVTPIYTVPMEKELFIDSIHWQNYNTAGWLWSYLDIYDMNTTFKQRIQSHICVQNIMFDTVLTYPYGLYIDQGESVVHERQAIASQSSTINIHGWLGPKRMT